MAITLEQFNNLGYKLYYHPAAPGYPEGYSAVGPSGVIQKLDPSTAQYLQSQGATLKTVPYREMGSDPEYSRYNTTGGNTVDMQYLDSQLQTYNDEQALVKQRELDQQMPAGIVQGPKTAENTAGWYTPESLAQYYAGTLNAPLQPPPGSPGEQNLVNIGTNNTSTAANAGSTPTQGGSTQPLPSGAKMFQVDGKAYFTTTDGTQAQLFDPAQYGIDINTLPSGFNNAITYQGGGTSGTQGGGVPTGGTNPDGTPAIPVPSNEQMFADAQALGIDSEMWAAMTPDMQAMFGAMGKTIQSKIEQGNPLPPTFTPEDLDALFQQAQNDPIIDRYYKDALRMGNADFIQSFSQLQGGYNEQQRQIKNQFDDARKAQSEQAAAAGQAYSGFRKQAQERLAQDQSGVIQSSRRQLQNNLYGLGTGFERTFGTGAYNTLAVNPIDGQLYNPQNVVGTQESAKLGDIRAKEQDLQQTALLSRGVTS